jgi:CheY-like chemotaxis protein
VLLKKQLGGSSAPPIIAVTARAAETDMRIAVKLGCSAFIGKPFLPEKLVSVVKEFLHASTDGNQSVESAAQV